MEKFIPKTPNTPRPMSSQTHHYRIKRNQAPCKTDGLLRNKKCLPKNDTNCIGNFINHLADDQETNLGEVEKKESHLQ